MDVINKLYCSVTSTVSQLSGVLPGNPLAREYEVEEYVTSVGVGLFWKVYNGYKKSTRQKVSIFVLEKKVLDNFPKTERDFMLNIFKCGIYQLTKIRHPNILTVQHPLEESRDSLAFATEPINSCLYDFLKKPKNKKPELDLFDVEIKRGLLQIVEGLIFLHSDMKIVHRNLNPKSIVINEQSSWKIFSFDFCVIGNPNNDNNYFWEFQEYKTNRHTLSQPPLEFTSPEFALNSTIVPESDLYAFGMLIYLIYAKGNSIIEFNGNFKSFNQFANELNRGNYPNLMSIPIDLREALKGFMHPSPNHRLKLEDFKNIQFFDDNKLKTLLYLDSLYQWDNLQKSKFYKGLSNIIPTFPKRVNLSTIIPSLVKEFVNPQMIPFVLPNVFLIAEGCDKADFEKHIIGSLIPVFKLEEPIQIIFIIMQNMDLIIKLTPTEQIKANILPMLYRILESDNSKLQVMCLDVIPNLTSLIQYISMKNSIMPRIQSLCLKSPSISVKVNCLICIGKLLEHLDKWIVLEEIIPFLTKIDNRDPATIMAIIGIIKIVLNHPKLGITKNVMSTKVIPFIMPFCIESGLTINQFKQVMDLVKTMVNKVESEQLFTLNQTSNLTNSSSLSNFAENFPKETLGTTKVDTVETNNYLSEDIKNILPSINQSFEIQKSSSINNHVISPFNMKSNNFSNNDKTISWKQSEQQKLLISSNNSSSQKLENDILEPLNRQKISSSTNSNTNLLTQQEILDFLN